MATLADLAVRMQKLAANVDSEANRAKVAVVNSIVAGLVRTTPVDTSQALSNWQVTYANPGNVGTIPPYFPGLAGSTQGTSAAEAISIAQTKLEAAQPKQTVYVVNALPYIRRLNEGYSGQAPAGFVEAQVLLSRTVIRNFKLRL